MARGYNRLAAYGRVQIPVGADAVPLPAASISFHVVDRLASRVRVVYLVELPLVIYEAVIVFLWQLARGAVAATFSVGILTLGEQWLLLVLFSKIILVFIFIYDCVSFSVLAFEGVDGSLGGSIGSSSCITSLLNLSIIHVLIRIHY